MAEDQEADDLSEVLPLLIEPLDSATVDAFLIAHEWLMLFSLAMRSVHGTFDSGHARAVSLLFTSTPASWWKDHLSLTWSLRTMRSLPQILELLQVTAPTRKPRGFTLVSAAFVSWSPVLAFVQARFTFSTDVANCSGVVKLVPRWKRQVESVGVFTRMDDLHGHEADVSRLDSFVPNPPKALCLVDVLIVGAGQSGLQLAAALRTMDLSAIVIEQEDNIGDHWRKHYDTLKLHVKKWFCRFLYRPLPENVSLYPTAAEIASYLDLYAKSTHLNVLTSTQVVRAVFKKDEQTWEVHLRHSNGDASTVIAKHFVMATGMTGQRSVMPSIPGREIYGGTLMHSHLYKNGADWRGRDAIVVGVGCSGHDIAHDLYDHGARVTMVQRNPSMVRSMEALDASQDLLYNEKVPVSAADIIWESLPVPLIKPMSSVTVVSEATKAVEMALTTAGFKLKDIDVAHALFNRGGGLYIDVGTSALIADGKVKQPFRFDGSHVLPSLFGIKSGVPIEGFTTKGLSFADGTLMDADLVVFATGYTLQTMMTTLRGIVGEEIGATLTDAWGLDEEGHLKGAFRNTGHPRIWYAAGDFVMARYYAKIIALQIKATELNILQRVQIRTDGKGFSDYESSDHDH